MRSARTIIMETTVTPKIDYEILGIAMGQFAKRGYKYVEVPWVVADDAIRATLPSTCPLQKLAYTVGSGLYEREPNKSALIGSAEQALITMNLPVGSYMAISPCFRFEKEVDLLHRDYFMKLELFVCGVAEDEAPRVVAHVIEDASEVMAFISDIRPVTVPTSEGKHTYDLTVGGVEVGSYGYRTCDDYTTPNESGCIRWVYGTGIALPRFSVANALVKICQ